VETLRLLAIPGGFFGVLPGVGYDVRTPVAGATLLLSVVIAVFRDYDCMKKARQS
jgi:hypothetical protein